MDRVKDIVKAIVNRYHTADPFVIAEKLNIQVEWCDFGAMPLGKNAYDNQEPIILLNNSIKHTPTQYFILGHELGHVIFHEGLIGTTLPLNMDILSLNVKLMNFQLD